MNLLPRIPGLGPVDEDGLSPEERAAEAKKQRIEFHRLYGRNGPVKFYNQSAGQVRRQRERALARKTSKARRKQIKTYLNEQRRAAVLRGQLQTLGILPYSATPTSVSAEQQDRALRWVVKHFIKPEEYHQSDLEHLACQRALNLWQRLTGQPETRLKAAE